MATKHTTANPAKPKTHNGYMTASGWGTIYIRVMSIEQGISIITSSSSQANGKTLYMHKRTGGSFSVGIRCATYEESEALAKWIQGYGRKASNPDAKIGAVRVVFPNRKFDSLAVPLGISGRGDTNRTLFYDYTIQFKGARDPNPKAASTFSLPKHSDDPALPYYYPAGTQLSGTGKADDSLYGSSTTATGSKSTSTPWAAPGTPTPE